MKAVLGPGFPGKPDGSPGPGEPPSVAAFPGKPDGPPGPGEPPSVASFPGKPEGPPGPGEREGLDGTQDGRH